MPLIMIVSMSMMPRISEDKRNNMKSMLQQGRSVREVSRDLRVGIASVSRVRKELGLEPERKTGRPRKISTVAARHVLRDVRTGKTRNAVVSSR